MILPCNREVPVPRLCVLCLLLTEVIQTVTYNFMIQPGAGNILHVTLSILGLVEHLQQVDVLPPVEAEVFDKVIKIRGLVLHRLPNNLGRHSVQSRHLMKVQNKPLLSCSGRTYTRVDCPLCI